MDLNSTENTRPISENPTLLTEEKSVVTQDSTNMQSRENQVRDTEVGKQQYDSKNVHYDGDTAIYTDQYTGYQYQWDDNKQEWIPRQNLTYEFEDDTHVYTEPDGTKLFWDKEKKAWFPKVDDDFMARYQMSYGFNEHSSEESRTVPDKEAPKVEAKLPKGEKRKASEPTWFQVNEDQNTNVYVSNLPLDIEEEEFVEFMQKCGLVMRDPVSGSFKVKLYKDPGTNYLKGDALCTYIRIESVELALNLLDGCNLRGQKIKVERAKFELKGEFNPKLKPKMKKRKEKMKLKKQQDKLFDWRPEKKEGEKSKHERIVIIKNLFDPDIFDKDVSLILEFQEDLREEAGKIGEVRKVTLFDRHPEGIAQITMGNPEEASQVVKMLNGRWFMKRQLSAEIYDGKTKYKISETDSQINQRLEGWDKFLEEEDNEGR
ncbi:17S U2 SnRNP complex component HTATSF1 [Euwallacea similis]|uniref:17S U2 SnRNP complex component HTATSF1 n=1 Tax=Euwallacea similis TaxID=1736056 RepID=UPI00344F0B85